VCGVPHVRGDNSVFGGRAATDGDHEYDSRSEPGVSESETDSYT
jgi:hypothetical protein